MRTYFIIVLLLLSAALVACAFIARRARRTMSLDVYLLLMALVIPIVGNSLTIVSSDWLVANIGCYLYYLGMDLVVIALLRFTTDYCFIRYQGTLAQKAVIALVIVDMAQLLLNPITGHAFATREILVEGAPYYALVPLAGQVFHRLVAYGIFAGSLAIFIYKCVKSPRIYLERYLVILLSMVFAGAWQSFYIFSGTPIDRSMIGFGVFGLLIFYFAMYYKPFRLLDRMLARVVASTGEGVLFFDREGSCIYVNDAAGKMLGIDGDSDEDLERCPQLVRDIAGDETFDTLRDWSCRRAVSLDEASQAKPVSIADNAHSMSSASGKKFWSLDFHVMNDNRKRHVGAFLSLRDRTKEELNLRREKYLATHDRLTGLFNKEHLYEEVQNLIAGDPDQEFLAVGMDVKDFKLANDIFNKEFGDRMLCWVADWMRHFAAAGAVYGRISGDRFGFVVPAAAFDDDLVNERLRNRVFHDEPTDVDYPVVLHLGVYEIVDSDLPVSIMFDRAFMALATVKGDYRRHVARYDTAMREDVMWRQQISSQLQDAIAEGQIRPYLQPMVDKDGRFEGAEVLVRWIHPEEGFLSPARFIPVFEDNGMIAQLDVHMWECACRILKDWESRGIDLFLSVNISPKDFYFIDVQQTILDLVDRYGIRPEKLRLEITETVMMSDVENRLRIIEDLRSSGFLVEMDDFGSGYSSLNMLKDIPVDVLKIDMMFLYKSKDADRAQTILKTIIELSRRLGVPSITEGVETAEQLSMLVSMGCHMFQGYYFAEPMPLAEFEEKLIAA